MKKKIIIVALLCIALGLEATIWVCGIQRAQKRDALWAAVAANKATIEDLYAFYGIK